MKLLEKLSFLMSISDPEFYKKFNANSSSNQIVESDNKFGLEEK